MSPQFMDNRMASRTKGDQGGGGVAAGAAVMNRPLIPCPAALAAVAVASEDGIAMAAEAPARVRGLRITPPAKARAKELEAPAAAAKEAGLSGFQQATV